MLLSAPRPRLAVSYVSCRCCSIGPIPSVAEVGAGSAVMAGGGALPVWWCWIQSATHCSRSLHGNKW